MSVTEVKQAIIDEKLKEAELSGLKVTFPKVEVDLDSRSKTATIFFEGKLSGDEL